MISKIFCKHNKSKMLYISRKAVNGKKQCIYYCPECRKYSRGALLFDKDEQYVAETSPIRLSWKKKLGDITGYIYLGS